MIQTSCDKEFGKVGNKTQIIYESSFHKDLLDSGYKALASSNNIWTVYDYGKSD